ncbi:hypothetical protein M0805_005372 [Coniferiporia weirii]|nr:hypothetical protein M0805_005372 [Coniferiporia weirii]
MIPLVPTLALSMSSFLFSVVVIIRVVLPVLPSHPLSGGGRAARASPPSKTRRTSSLAETTSLSPTDKAYICIAACDLLSLAVFIWEVFAEYLGGLSVSGDAVLDPASAVRLWLTLTFRQTCLLVIIAATLVQVRLGKPASFGYKQWVIWVPTLLITTVSASVAGVLTDVGVKGLFIGVVSFSVVVAVLSTTALVYIAATLLAIRRNLPAPSRHVKSWRRAMEEKSHRHTLAKEAIEALKDGSSWITSDAGSHRNSISAFSFSTVHSTRAELVGARSDLIADAEEKTSYVETDTNHDIKRFPGTNEPLFATPQGQNASSHCAPHVARENEDNNHSKISQHDNSWLTEPSVSQTTMSMWSFPTASADGLTLPNVAMVIHPQMCGSRPGVCLVTPALSSMRVLDDCINPSGMSCNDTERGFDIFAVQRVKDLNVNVSRIVGWLVLLWVPLAFSLPYLLMATPRGFTTNTVTPIFLILSVSLSAPILALSVVFTRLLVPTGPYERSIGFSSSIDFGSRYKRSGSITVVDGRRSGDVWLIKGDAVHSKGGLSRAASLLSPLPKLSVLPQAEYIVSENSRAGSPSPLTMRGDVTASLALSRDIISSRNLSKGLGCNGETDESELSLISGGLSALTDTVETEDRLCFALERAPESTFVRDDVASKSLRGAAGGMYNLKETSMARLETIMDVSVMDTPARGSLDTGSSLTPGLVDIEPPIESTASTVCLRLQPAPSQRLVDQALQDRRHLGSTTKTMIGGMNDLKEGPSASLHPLPKLSASLTPRADGDATMQSTAEGIRRHLSLTSLASFSSPELTSTPPLSRSNGVESLAARRLKGRRTTLNHCPR